MSRNDLPPPSAKNYLGRLRETLMTYLGRQGDQLDRGVTLRDLVDSGLAALRPGYSAGSLPPGSVLPIVPGPALDPEVDLTPPPTPTGLSVTAGLNHLFIECANPSYTQGHGHLRTRVYGAIYTGGALPTFSSAAEIAQFTGTIFAYPSNLGTEWHIWIKWESADGVLSASPAGGTNGASATTGKIANADLNALIIEAGNLAAGAVTTAKFASGIEPVGMVSSVPGTQGSNPSTVFNTGDAKLYRWNGSAYVSTIPATDLSGTILAAQIAAAQIGSSHLTQALLDQIGPPPSPDTTAPGVVTSVGATGGIRTITLSWTAPSDTDIAGYQVWRAGSNDRATATQVASILSTVYSDPTASGTTYYYWIKAFDTSGNVGAFHAGVNAGQAGTTGSVASADILDNAITAVKIAAGQVTAAKTAIAAIDSTTGNLTANSVTAAAIAAGQVTAGKLATDSVVAANIQAGAITSDKMTVNTINANVLAAGTILAGKLGADSVVTANLVAGTITGDRIAAATITGSNLVADTITAAHIAASAITSSELAANAVIAGKIAAGTIVAGDIAAGTITGDRIAANTIAAANLVANSITAGQIAAGAISATEIAAGAISATKLAANAIAVGTAAIQNGAIVNAMIGALAVDTAKIADLAVSTAKIAALAVTNAQINDLNATKINAGFLDVANRINAGSITAGKIDSTGLSIKDAAGNVILAAGSSLSWTDRFPVGYTSGLPASNATKNTVTYSASAPGSPTEGDIWVDTSVSPNLSKYRISGAWQVGANYSSNTNQLTDGANLGGTATWTGVSGAGKPIQYRVTAAGYQAAPPNSVGLFNLDSGANDSGANYWTMVARFNLATGAWIDSTQFNLYSGGASAANAMQAFLDGSCTPSHLVVIWSYDQPGVYAIRTTGTLLAAMKRCGASDGVWGYDDWGGSRGYILIGVPDIGAGNGYELLSKHPGPSWCSTTFVIQNGSANISGGGSQPNIVWSTVFGSGKPADNATVGATFGVNIGGQINSTNISTFIADAAIKTAQIGALQVTGPLIANDTITTPKIIVGAASVASSANYGSIGGTFTTVSSITETNNTVTSLTSTGAPVKNIGYLVLQVDVTSGLLFKIVLEVNLRIDSVSTVLGTIEGRALVTVGSRTTWVFPIVHRHTPSAAAHNYGYLLNLYFKDSSGNASNCTGSWNGACYLTAEENKV